MMAEHMDCPEGTSVTTGEDAHVYASILEGDWATIKLTPGEARQLVAALSLAAESASAVRARSHRREIIAYGGNDLPSKAECRCPTGWLCPRHQPVYYPAEARHRKGGRA